MARGRSLGCVSSGGRARGCRPRPDRGAGLAPSLRAACRSAPRAILATSIARGCCGTRRPIGRVTRRSSSDARTPCASGSPRPIPSIAPRWSGAPTATTPRQHIDLCSPNNIAFAGAVEQESKRLFAALRPLLILPDSFALSGKLRRVERGREQRIVARRVGFGSLVFGSRAGIGAGAGWLSEGAAGHRAGGIVNWASRMPPQLAAGGVAPGSLIRIRGWRLGPAPLAKILDPHPLGRTSGDHRRFPLGENEVEARVPEDAPLGDAMLQVVKNGRASLEWPVSIVPLSFGALSRNGQGWGPARLRTRMARPIPEAHLGEAGKR